MNLLQQSFSPFFFFFFFFFFLFFCGAPSSLFPLSHRMRPAALVVGYLQGLSGPCLLCCTGYWLLLPHPPALPCFFPFFLFGFVTENTVKDSLFCFLPHFFFYFNFCHRPFFSNPNNLTSRGQSWGGCSIGPGRRGRDAGIKVYQAGEKPLADPLIAVEKGSLQQGIQHFRDTHKSTYIFTLPVLHN